MDTEEFGASSQPTERASNLDLIKVLFALVCFTLCGCATPRTYMQAGASPKQTNNSAKITCDSEHAHTVLIGLNQKLFIAAIDGKSTATFAGAMTDTAPYAETAYVIPGRHYLDLKYTHANSFASGKVWFDAEAGMSYIIRRKTKNYSITFWVEELETGKIVGGIPGGEPASNGEQNREFRHTKDVER